VSNLEVEISNKDKDILQKYATSLFKNESLEFYGIKVAKIKEIISVDLPVIKVASSFGDEAFLLEDDSYLRFEFQTGYKKKDLVRFCGYDLRLFERDGRKVHTVIIYTSDVKNKPKGIPLDMGAITYNPTVVLMAEYDGDKIFAELDAKLKAGEELTDLDMLNLIFLPLMKNAVPRKELAAKSVELAQTIPDETRRNACIAATFAFAKKYLNDDEINRLLEVLKLTDLAIMFIEQGREEGRELGREEGKELGREEGKELGREEGKELGKEEGKKEIAKRMLKMNMLVDQIVEFTELSIEEISELKNEIEYDEQTGKAAELVDKDTEPAELQAKSDDQ